MQACAGLARSDDLITFATAMEDLPPDERDRRIALGGDKIIDLRDALRREQHRNRGHEL